MPRSQGPLTAAPYESLSSLLAYYSERADDAEREALLGLLLGLINNFTSSVFSERQEMKALAAFPEGEAQFVLLMRLSVLLSESSDLIVLSDKLWLFESLAFCCQQGVLSRSLRLWCEGDGSKLAALMTLLAKTVQLLPLSGVDNSSSRAVYWGLQVVVGVVDLLRVYQARLPKGISEPVIQHLQSLEGLSSRLNSSASIAYFIEYSLSALTELSSMSVTHSSGEQVVAESLSCRTQVFSLVQHLRSQDCPVAEQEQLLSHLCQHYQLSYQARQAITGQFLLEQLGLLRQEQAWLAERVSAVAAQLLASARTLQQDAQKQAGQQIQRYFLSNEGRIYQTFVQSAQAANVNKHDSIFSQAGLKARWHKCFPYDAEVERFIAEPGLLAEEDKQQASWLRQGLLSQWGLAQSQLLQEKATSAWLNLVKGGLYQHYRHQLGGKSLSGRSLDLGEQGDYITLSLVESCEQEKETKEAEGKKTLRKLPGWSCLYSGAAEQPQLKNKALAQRYGVFAPPGGGKTTLLHKLVVDNLHNTAVWPQFEWVVLLRCRDLTRAFQKEKINRNTSLSDLIYRFYLLPLSHKDRKTYTVERLQDLAQSIANKSESMLLLLDGLDEYEFTGESGEVLDRLFRLPHLLVSGREHTKTQLLSKAQGLSDASFAQIEISGFSSEAIERYVAHYFKQAPEIESSLMSVIKRHYTELASNPVCLEVLCFIASTSGDSTETLGKLRLAELYEQVVTKLLRRHAVLRLGDKEKNLTLKALQHSESWRFLQVLAWDTFNQNKVGFGYLDCEQALSEIQITEPEACHALLQSGLLRGSGLGEWHEQDYEFLHLTFQEYLAASSFVERLQTYVNSEKTAQSTRAFQHFFNGHKYHARYLRLWQFVMGMVSQDIQQFNQFEQFWCGVLSFQKRDEEKALSNQLLQGFAYGCDILLKRQIAVQLGEILQGIRRDEDLKKDEALKIAGTLGAVLLEQPMIISGLVTALTDEEKDVRESASGAIEQAGPALMGNSDFVSGLLEALTDKNAFVRYYSAKALEQSGFMLTKKSDVVSDLLIELIDEERDIRVMAVLTIAALGFALAENPDVVSGLAKALTDEEWEVRVSATVAIGKLGPALAGNPSVVSGLLEALTDEEGNVSSGAASAIGKLGSALAGSREVVSGLLAVLADEEMYVRGRAVEAIGRLGPALAGNREVVSGLLAALADEQRFVRGSATEAIGELGSALAEDSDVVSGLLEALTDKNESVRSRAAIALARLGPTLVENSKVISALLIVLTDEDAKARDSAAWALGKLRYVLEENTTFVSHLLEMLTDKEWEIRSCAVQIIMMGRLGFASAGNSKIIFSLLMALTDEKWVVRLGAVWAVSELTPTFSAMKFILRRLLIFSLPKAKGRIDSLVAGLCNYLSKKKITFDGSTDREAITFFCNGESWQVARTIINSALWQRIQTKLQAERASSDWAQALVPRVISVKEDKLSILEQKREKAALALPLALARKENPTHASQAPAAPMVFYDHKQIFQPGAVAQLNMKNVTMETMNAGFMTAGSLSVIGQQTIIPAASTNPPVTIAEQKAREKQPQGDLTMLKHDQPEKKKEQPEQVVPPANPSSPANANLTPLQRLLASMPFKDYSSVIARYQQLRELDTAEAKEESTRLSSSLQALVSHLSIDTEAQGLVALFRCGDDAVTRAVMNRLVKALSDPGDLTTLYSAIASIGAVLQEQPTAISKQTAVSVLTGLLTNLGKEIHVLGKLKSSVSLLALQAAVQWLDGLLLQGINQIGYDYLQQALRKPASFLQDNTAQHKNNHCLHAFWSQYLLMGIQALTHQLTVEETDALNKDILKQGCNVLGHGAQGVLYGGMGTASLTIAVGTILIGGAGFSLLPGATIAFTEGMFELLKTPYKIGKDIRQARQSYRALHLKEQDLPEHLVQTRMDCTEVAEQAALVTLWKNLLSAALPSKTNKQQFWVYVTAELALRYSAPAMSMNLLKQKFQELYRQNHEEIDVQQFILLQSQRLHQAGYTQFPALEFELAVYDSWLLDSKHTATDLEYYKKLRGKTLDKATKRAFKEVILTSKKELSVKSYVQLENNLIHLKPYQPLVPIAKALPAISLQETWFRLYPQDKALHDLSLSYQEKSQALLTDAMKQQFLASYSEIAVQSHKDNCSSWGVACAEALDSIFTIWREPMKPNPHTGALVKAKKTTVKGTQKNIKDDIQSPLFGQDVTTATALFAAIKAERRLDDAERVVDGIYSPPLVEAEEEVVIEGDQENIEQRTSGYAPASNPHSFHQQPAPTAPTSYAKVEKLCVEIDYMELSAYQAKMLQAVLNGPKGYRAALCDKKKTREADNFMTMEDEQEVEYQARLRLYFRTEVAANHFKAAVDAKVAELKETKREAPEKEHPKP